MSTKEFLCWEEQGATVRDESGKQLTELSIGQTIITDALFGETSGKITWIDGNDAMAKNSGLLLPLFKKNGSWRCAASINRKAYETVEKRGLV